MMMTMIILSFSGMRCYSNVILPALMNHSLHAVHIILIYIEISIIIVTYILGRVLIRQTSVPLCVVAQLYSVCIAVILSMDEWSLNFEPVRHASAAFSQEFFKQY